MNRSLLYPDDELEPIILSRSVEEQSSSVSPVVPEKTTGTWTEGSSSVDGIGAFPDIGNILAPSKSTDELWTSLNALSNGEKFSLLYNHVQPPNALPSTFSYGANRRFQISWLSKYPWLLYSPKLDGVFCGPCALFMSIEKRKDKGLLVNKPFSNWIKISSILSDHCKLKYHLDSVQLADALRSSIQNPTSQVHVMTNKALELTMRKNEHILRQIVRAILFLAKQGIAFRGKVEDIELNKNPGNFLALLKTFAESDEVLYDHLYNTRAKNATHLSPRTQNEIIGIIGNDVILSSIISSIKKAKYFSVLADEVSCHNVEHLPICVRFVDDNDEIREEFITFLKLERVRADDIANSIIQSLEGFGLSLDGLRGQGYDGASTMSGVKAGVQAKILEKQPKALYTHCAGHSINLAILNSCSVPSIRNCIDQIKGFTLWIKYSAKREGLLKAIIGKRSQVGTNRASILNVCVTRWVENIDGWERFSQYHPFLIELCEVVIYGNSEFCKFNDGWSAEDKKNALAHLKALESFEFVYSLVTLFRSLSYIKEAIVKLQGKSQDLVSGMGIIERCSKELIREREDIDNYSQRIFRHSSRLAQQSNIQIMQPRTNQRQQHCSNPNTTSVEEYFKLSVAIPFLDHLISDIGSRFSEHSKRVATLQGLLPINITSSTTFSDIEPAIALYSDDLPNPLILDEELHRWKLRWLEVSQQGRPETLSDALKQCSPEHLPNINTLLKLFATLPLSSCSCERSASALCRLNNYLRSTQTAERLSALALIHIAYETEINLDTVCKLYLGKYPRRIECASLLFQ